MFKKIFDLNKLSTLLLYTSILTFIISFNFAHNPPNGWQQQFMPNLNNRPLSDVQFIDSLVGYGITGDHTGGDTNYVIKTTNGGDNWVIINTIYKDLSRIKFINANTGYVCGGLNGNPALFIKTTNGGMNWFDINGTLEGRINDIFVLNEDTIWYTDEAGLVGGLFRTTDGGSSWIRQFYANGNIPARIYMVNSQTGFFSSSGGSFLNKTTDGGFNWFVINGEKGFIEMFFTDSLEGWKTLGDTMRFTTNGGINWIKQILPSGGVIQTSVMTRFHNLNADTIWGCGGWIHYGGNEYRGILYRTTNKGINWYYQIPDTAIHIAGYEFIGFFLKKYAWVYSNYPNYITGIHSTVGGDTTFYTGITKQNENIPAGFELKQNYPNPFNPRTVIPFSLNKRANVKLNAYDVTGREVQQLVSGIYNAGEYEVDFMGKYSSSGVYFYKIEISDDSSREKFTETKRMILIK